MTNHDDPLADNPYDMDDRERYGDPFAPAERSEYYCSSCEEDMSEEDYMARMAERDPWEALAGIMPECDDCMGARRDASLENPYG